MFAKIRCILPQKSLCLLCGGEVGNINVAISVVIIVIIIILLFSFFFLRSFLVVFYSPLTS